jgi:hypothetical protein
MSQPKLISGGFYVTRTISRPAGLGDVLLPARLITLTSCLTEFLPDLWALDWTSCSTDERIAAVKKLGVPEELLPTLKNSATDALNRGDLGWPCVWQSASAARAALELVKGAPVELVVLELGVPEDAAAMLLAELAPRTGEAESGFLKKLISASSLEPRSVPLGWEVLGAEDGGSFHSWLCNSLHDDASAKLNVRPGPLGLLEAEDDAAAIVELIEGGLGAEPVPWFRGSISRVE